jgi:hypothetical protein
MVFSAGAGLYMNYMTHEQRRAVLRKGKDERDKVISRIISVIRKGASRVNLWYDTTGSKSLS